MYLCVPLVYMVSREARKELESQMVVSHHVLGLEHRWSARAASGLNHAISPVTAIFLVLTRAKVTFYWSRMNQTTEYIQFTLGPGYL